MNADQLSAGAWILILMLGASILAAIIVWLLMRNRIQRLIAEREPAEEERKTLAERNIWLNERLKESEARVSALEAEILTLKAGASESQEARERLAQLEPELGLRQQEINRLRAAMEKMEAGADRAAADEIAALKATISELKEKMKTRSVTPPLDEGDSGFGKRTEVDDAHEKYAAAQKSEEEILSRIRQKADKIDFGRIGTAGEHEREDLKKIHGIGPFIERKLNALGIFTYRQIANFTPEDEHRVTEAIEFFPGRIDRDNWVGQAKYLIGAHNPQDEEETLSRIRKRINEIDFDRIGTADHNHRDNLKLIHGIGPWIERKLNYIGIYTYRQISNFNEHDVEKINEIIEFFPGRIQRDHWVDQASKLAAAKAEERS